MSGQDTISQDLFSTTRCSRKKEETKQNNQNTWISHKRACLQGACKLHYEKKILQEEISSSILVHLIFLSLEVFLTKALFLGGPPEPLKCLTSVVQEPPAPSLSVLQPLFLLSGSVRSVRRILRQNQTTDSLCASQALLKGLNPIRFGLRLLNQPI